MDPAVTSLVVLAGAVALFLWNRLPVGVVAVLTALSLYATGVLGAGQALAGFGDPIVIFVASLFVVSEALDATGVTTWAGQALTDRAGTGRRELLVTIMVLAGVLTAVVSPNGSVAALLPMVVVVAVRNGHSPSQLAMPLAFAAHAGSLLALSGSPVNIIVSDAAAQEGAGPFGFFEFAILGVPLLAVTIALSALLGPRLLPATAAGSSLADLSRHARTLSGHYALQDGFYRLTVRAGSSLVGTPLPGGDPPGLSVLGVQTARGAAHPAEHIIDAGDAIIVTGPAEAVIAFAGARQLDVGLRPVTADALLTREAGVVEVVVPPRSPLVGERVFPGMVRLGEVVILAVRHRGLDRGPRGAVLGEGDSLLLHGPWAVIDSLVDDRDVLVVDAPDRVRRQAVPLGAKAIEALAVLAAMVVLLVTGAVPPAVAGLGAAAAIVALRVVTPQHAYRAVSWQTVVLLGGLIPLSTAISTSGAADLLAGALLGVVGNLSPYLLLLVVFAVTAALGQVVSNTATALIVVPIAVAAAVEGRIAVEPVLMTVAVAGAASFLTPIATPANMMVMGPGGYRFGDYWRLGAVVLVAWLAIALLVIPVVWPLR
ncbi:SLC13 family permease [Georgenia sp. SYP-B2076]|uniref:SLC13 family permease n=1 Tax=Georgenia sp. SYP-B2076 TaxID=2495881 RepID=UPI000F8C5642|nr:SLC13 family permease [Georgenia sp. SYP-B2076]